MKSKTVAILETRTGEHLAELIERRGGTALLAPALEEVPDVDPKEVATLLDGWKHDPYRLVIFQTGVGTRALFEVTEGLGKTPDLMHLLERAQVLVRGPKPTGELNARKVRIDLRAASPFTSDTVLQALAEVDLDGAAVLVQRYGAANRRLCAALEARGAKVREIATYRWSLPRDTQPLRALLDALEAATVDAVVFTSAIQVENLHTFAATIGKAGSLADRLNRLIVASIGPVCSRALAAHGITPTFEADPPKLGPLLSELDKALGG